MIKILVEEGDGGASFIPLWVSGGKLRAEKKKRYVGKKKESARLKCLKIPTGEGKGRAS